VTINEQVTAFQGPSVQQPQCQNFQQAPQYQVQQQQPQLPQQPRLPQPQRQYNAVPPPNGVRRIGPKHQTYPPLPETLEDIFAALMLHNVIQLPPRKEVWSPRLDHTKYCPYHRSPGHLISNYFTFKDWVYDLNDAGRINWADLKGVIAGVKRAPPQQNNLGIVQNPLPNYQGQQPAGNPPPPNNQAQITTLFTSDEPTCVRRIQTCSYEGEEPVEPPYEFITMGAQGQQTAVIIWEEINR